MLIKQVIINEADTLA